MYPCMHAIARVPCFQSVEACIQGPELAAARAPSPTCPSHRAPNLALPPQASALPCLGLPPTLNPVHHREHHLTSTHRQPWVSHSARCVLAVSLPWLWPCWARADRRSSFHGRLSPCARAPSRRRRNSCVSATSSVWRQQAEHNRSILCCSLRLLCVHARAQLDAPVIEAGRAPS